MELACVYDWLKCNKLSLYITNSKYMIFPHRTAKLNVDLLQLNIENTSIDRVSDIFFLGLTINEYFN